MCGCTNQTILGVSDPDHKTMNHSLCGLVQHNVNRDSAGGLHLECVPFTTNPTEHLQLTAEEGEAVRESSGTV